MSLYKFRYQYGLIALGLSLLFTLAVRTLGWPAALNTLLYFAGLATTIVGVVWLADGEKS